MTEDGKTNPPATPPVTPPVTPPAPTGETQPANPLTDADKAKAAELAQKAKDEIQKSVIDSLDSLKPKDAPVDPKITSADAKVIEDKVRAEVRAELIAKEKEATVIKEKEEANKAVVDLTAQVAKLQETINNPSVGGRQPVNTQNPLDGKPPVKVEDMDDAKIKEIDTASMKAFMEERSK